MNKEEIIKAINELPKIHNHISAMNSINIEDLYDAIDRFNKVPTYIELLKENKKLKLNHKQLKDIEKMAISNSNMIQENKQLKTRINKSIEILEKELKESSCMYCETALKIIATLKILKGEQNE